MIYCLEYKIKIMLERLFELWLQLARELLAHIQRVCEKVVILILNFGNKKILK